MSEHSIDNPHPTSNSSAEKWRVVGDLNDEPLEEQPRRTLGERHLSFVPSGVRGLEEIARQGRPSEEHKWHLRQETLNRLGTADYGPAAVVYEHVDGRGLVASHYVSLKDETFGQPITDPEAQGLPIITGLSQGDLVPDLRTQTPEQVTSEAPSVDMHENQALLPAGDEELLLPSGNEHPGVEAEVVQLEESEHEKPAPVAGENASIPGETNEEAPLPARERRRRDAKLLELRDAVEAVATQSTSGNYYNFESAVNGTLYLRPSELSISSIEDAVNEWENTIRSEREKLGILSDALSGYGDFDLNDKVVSLGRTYVRNIEYELDDIDDRCRRIKNDDMEDARNYGEFNTSMIQQRMTSMLDGIERIKGYRSQITYLIEGEEEKARLQTAEADTETEPDTMLADLETNHVGEIDESAPARQGVVDEGDFSEGSFMAKREPEYHLPERGTSLTERQRRRGVIEE